MFKTANRDLDISRFRLFLNKWKKCHRQFWTFRQISDVWFPPKRTLNRKVHCVVLGKSIYFFKRKLWFNSNLFQLWNNKTYPNFQTQAVNNKTCFKLEFHLYCMARNQTQNKKDERHIIIAVSGLRRTAMPCFSYEFLFSASLNFVPEYFRTSAGRDEITERYSGFFWSKMLGARYGPAGTRFSDSRDPIFSSSRDLMIIFSGSIQLTRIYPKAVQYFQHQPSQPAQVLPNSHKTTRFYECRRYISIHE